MPYSKKPHLSLMHGPRLLIGLTGGIASGKTTVARLLMEQGVPVIDADEVARELVEPGESALEEITVAFGTGVLDGAGRLDREKLRERVFTVPGDRSRLEAILHPRIRQEMFRRSDGVAGPYCVLAIPLLLETGQDDFTAPGDANPGRGPGRRTRILVVDTPVEQQIRRACQRDGSRADIIKAIISAQASREERLAAADDVITNDADLGHLHRRTMILHRRYLEMARGTANP